MHHARYCRHREDTRDINSRKCVRTQKYGKTRGPVSVVRVYYMNATPFVFRSLFLLQWLYYTRGIISAVRFNETLHSNMRVN